MGAVIGDGLGFVIQPGAPPAPAQGRQVLLGVLPFLLLGLSLTMIQVSFPMQLQAFWMWLIGALFFGSFLAILAGLLAGWLAGFPRWAYPYLLYSIFFSLYLSNASTPGLAIFNVQLWGREVWGWRAWVPLALVYLLAVCLNRSPWGNLQRMFKGIWEDWTVLVFGLYGLLPFIAILVMDEVDHAYTLPLALLTMVALVAGAWLYMRLPRRGVGALCLAGMTFVAMWVAASGSEFYWKTHDVNLTTGERHLLAGPAPLGESLSRGIWVAVTVALLLLLPIIIGLVHGACDYFKQCRSR
jgi:hypothetical protein